jgi:hypothetical protein
MLGQIVADEIDSLFDCSGGIEQLKYFCFLEKRKALDTCYEGDDCSKYLARTEL